MVNKLSELFRKIRPVNYVTIEFWFQYTLLQTFLQASIIFFHQPTVSAIKFGTCFTMFMLKIALYKDFGGQGFVTTTEVTNVKRRPSETNKLRYEIRRGTSSSRNEKLNISKSKSSCL